MAKVAPETELPVANTTGGDGGNTNVAYGKPFKKEALPGTGFVAWPKEYIEKRERLGHAFCTLPDGRKLCYWTEGDPADTPIIAFHGGCEGKYKWMQKEPIPGVFLIAVDR